MTNNNQQASGGAEGEKPHRVSVTAPARLHFGFLNLHGGLGRRFGSFGMAVDGFSTRLYAVPTTNADNLRVEGPDHYRQTIKRASSFANTITDGLDLERAAAITIEEAIPDHAGLGSGTQLGLAVATALTKLHGLDLGAGEMARLLGRGARSGIGIGVFEQGGVILDGGVAGDGSDDGADNGKNGPPPPVTSRLAFPDEWRLMLILDLKSKGLHGSKESDAFDALPPCQPGQAANLCRMVLMQALPALMEKNISDFGRAVTALQKAVGDHFVSVQGGRYSSSRVEEVLSWLSGQEVRGYGQSSWGPTGFAFFESQAEATRMIKAAEQKWRDDGGLQFMICGGRNQGCLVEIA